MLNKSHGPILAGLLLVLAGVGHFLWHASSVVPDSMPASWHIPDEFKVGDEPITPLPLTVSLDARKVALGRRLFSDTRLSRDNTVSCESCHALNKGGVDGLPRSVGIQGATGDINAPTVFNSGFNFRQFWDGRAASLEDQIDGPVQNPKEMGASWPEVVAALEKDGSYHADFAALYQSGIQRESIKDAIATFERSLITPNARFDRFLRGESNQLDGQEFAGYQLFKELGCASCHQGSNVGGNMYEKLGLVENYFEIRGNVQTVDYGRFNLTGNEEHRYEFRVPSLRNVALTAPYFHDASAPTLEKAVTIMAKYQLGVELGDADVAKIVKFLNTLTGEIPPSLHGELAK
ncbi:MAG: cytochrome-c peroxidase [Gallionella sp.]|nr:cytochrome-c peroxidase [Gallionella sp.]MDD4947556.1 cytochrome-c peroxidase [Gallionella sp.]MDD5612025.1 cytochrome-c peroxidase [Gallionella sp.]